MKNIAKVEIGYTPKITFSAVNAVFSAVFSAVNVNLMKNIVCKIFPSILLTE